VPPLARRAAVLLGFGVVCAAFAADPKPAAPKSPDAELLEYLGGSDDADAELQEYLAQRDAAKSQDTKPAPKRGSEQT
jgi:hypothetical protein